VSGRELRQASIHVVEGHSLVIPLIIEGLPEAVACLGEHWQRKREFHLTAVAERLLDGQDWDPVFCVASGRALGPVSVGREFRRVRHPDEPALKTLIVMAECPGLGELVEQLSRATGLSLPVPPAHVTLYSADPVQGIGITDEGELAERAPELTQPQQEEVRRALGW
jgi:hypothetical protein